MDYATEALGLVIKELREQRQMTQELLGRTAGYSGGAGVSISRIESGLTRPSAPRLAGIAGALGVTPERLESLAKAHTEEGVRTPPATARGAGGSVQARLKDIQERTKMRTDKVEALASSFNDAYERARTAYFWPFMEVAKGIEGAPLPEMPAQKNRVGIDDVARDAYTTADEVSMVYRSITAELVRWSATGKRPESAGGTEIFASLARAVTLGMASSGVMGSALAGAGTTNAALARSGGEALASAGSGFTAGPRLLTSTVAAPIAILAAGGLYFAHRRNKAQEAKLKAQLDMAEASLDATQAGFEYLTSALVRAAAILEYIGVHAAHALERWKAGIGVRPIEWGSLTPDQRHSYAGFFDIAACELATESTEAQHLMTSQGDDLRRLAMTIYATLDRADVTVRSLV
jgi:transcriptional regulator with XRE-family HTH domain